MKFRLVMKKILFTLLFIAGGMKYSFVSAVVRVNRPIKNVNKAEWDIETNMLEATMETFMEEVLR